MLHYSWRVCLSVILALVTLPLVAAPPAKKQSGLKKTEPAKPAETVELFAAIAAKQVAVRFIPADATQARLYVNNQSDKPLAVEIPPAFAGTPIVPPLEGPYAAALAEQVPQTLGSVVQTATPAPYRSPNGQPAPYRSPDAPLTPSANGDRPAELGPKPKVVTIAPKAIQEVPIVCVCLDYGKPTPNPNMPFTIAKIDSVARRPEVKVLLEEFAKGQFDQQVTQLAAWHFSNTMSWGELADTDFAPERINDARKLVAYIQQKTKEKK
jgi:hypothetical protein